MNLFSEKNKFDRFQKIVFTSLDERTDGRTDGKQGALKMQDQKMQDLKMQDQIAEVENAGPENAGPPVNTANR